MSLNHVILMGRLGRDPELRYTKNGTPVANFTLAVDRYFKDKNTGERGTDWIKCIAWRSTAEYARNYFTKGRMAVVEGRLQVREWTDKDNNRRNETEVLVSNMYFADSRRQENSAPAPSQPTYAPPTDNSDNFSELQDDDGFLPF